MIHHIRRWLRTWRRARPAPDTTTPGVAYDPARHEPPAQWRRIEKPEQPKPGWIDVRKDWLG